MRMHEDDNTLLKLFTTLSFHLSYVFWTSVKKSIFAIASDKRELLSWWCSHIFSFEQCNWAEFWLKISFGWPWWFHATFLGLLKIVFIPQTIGSWYSRIGNHPNSFWIWSLSNMLFFQPRKITDILTILGNSLKIYHITLDFVSAIEALEIDKLTKLLCF